MGVKQSTQFIKHRQAVLNFLQQRSTNKTEHDIIKAMWEIGEKDINTKLKSMEEKIAEQEALIIKLNNNDKINNKSISQKVVNTVVYSWVIYYMGYLIWSHLSSQDKYENNETPKQ